MAITNDEWLDAIANNDLQGSREGIKLGFDINQANDRGITPLMVASYSNYPELTALLLDNHADPELRDAAGYTASMHAAGAGAADVLRVFLDKNAIGSNQSSASSHRVDTLNAQLKKILEKYSLSSSSEETLDPSVSASIKRLIELGADIATEGYGQRKAVSIAAQFNDFDLVWCLLDQGADIESSKIRKSPSSYKMSTRYYTHKQKIETELNPDIAYNSLLVYAIKNQNYRAAHELISRGAIVNCAYQQDFFVQSVLEILIKNDAPADEFNYFFRSINPDTKTIEKLLKQAFVHSSSIVRYFHESGIINQLDRYTLEAMCTKLIYYNGPKHSGSANIEHVTESLLYLSDAMPHHFSQRCDPDELIRIAIKGNWQALDRLLDLGASPNISDDRGWTCVSHIMKSIDKQSGADIEENFARCIDTLVRHGIDPKLLHPLEKKLKKLSRARPVFCAAVETTLLKKNTSSSPRRHKHDDPSMGL